MNTEPTKKYEADENSNILKLIINDDARLTKKQRWMIYLRQIAILLFLVIALGLYSYDRFFAEEELPIVNVDLVKIDNILLEKYIDSADYSKTSDVIPIEVINFIDANRLETLSKTKKIVIYEIEDPTVNKEKITELIKEGDALLKGDKLTSPPGKNALEKYADVLYLDADNEAATAGIQKIYERYIFFIEKVISKKETFKVPTLLNSVVKLSPYRSDIQETIEKYRQYIDDTAFLNLSAASVSPAKLTEAQLTKEVSESEAPTVVKRSIGDIDREIALAASRMIDQGDTKTAREILETFLGQVEMAGMSYDVLLQTYLLNQAFEKAEMLVYQNANLDVYSLAENVARIVAARGDLTGALQILESHQPEITNYQDFFFFKAGLNYKLGNTEAASTIYRQLLETEYQNPRYWLGLAVSMESDNSDAALQAFVYANNYSQENSRVKRYINQHVLVLPQK